MICTIVHQLTRNLTVEQIKEQGFADYYVDHTVGLWPQASSGVPFNAATFQSTGDPIADLTEDLAADGAGRKKQHHCLLEILYRHTIIDYEKEIFQRNFSSMANRIQITCKNNFKNKDSAARQKALTLQWISWIRQKEKKQADLFSL